MLLDAASAALAALRDGSPDAGASLAAAEATYSGDFLEEDAYEDCGRAARRGARRLHRGRSGARRGRIGPGDADAATRYYLRVLERDRHDEAAHLGLVTALDAAGRHGEARRRFRAYCARMESIGIESASFPAVTAVARS